jgi:hypothetical protein
VQVQVLKADGSLDLRTIRIGIKSEISAEVKSGLQENEKVVVGGIPVKGAKKSALSSSRGR